MEFTYISNKEKTGFDAFTVIHAILIYVTF